MRSKFIPGRARYAPRPIDGSATADVLYALRRPVEYALTLALRRIARLPDAPLARLGAFEHAIYVIAPDELPVAFRLEPGGPPGRVSVVRRDDPRPVTAMISGPLSALLELFTGGADADAAFFSRAIKVEGDTGAVVALHNAIEAAELSLSDLVAAPAPVRRFTEPGLRGLAGLLPKAQSQRR